MVTLIDLVSKIKNQRLPGIFNGLRVRFGSGNYNVYSGPTHNKLGFSCIFFLLFLSEKYPTLHRNGTLGIFLILFSKFYIDNNITSELVSHFLLVL